VFKRRFKNQAVGYTLIGVLTGTNFLIDVYAGLISGPAITVKLAIIFIMFRLIFKGKSLHIGLMTILLLICIAVADIVVAVSFAAVFGFNSFEFITTGYFRVLFGITSKIVFLIISRLILSRFKNLNSTEPKDLYTILMVLLINIAFIVLACDIYFQSKSVFNNDLLFITGILSGIVFITVLVVRMTESIVSYAMKERDWQLQEDEYNRQMFYLNHLDDVNHEMKSIRHDFNHHISCLYGMLEQGNSENAKEYAGELVSNAEQFNVAFSSGYPGISGLLSSKYQKMRMKQIDFDWSVDLPTNLKIKLIDLSVILGNGIDNAIEAVEKLDNPSKEIQLKIYCELDYLVIKITNKYSPDSLDINLQTSKLDSDNHGYGIKNIKFVVSKYDGILKIDTDNDVFKLNVALPN